MMLTRGRMRLLLLLILPFLNGRSIVRERNDVIKQALIPTLVNIIGHARMAEHGTGIDELLDLINKDKLLDPFLKWLGWVTDKILEKDAEETSDKFDESGEITEYDEQELKQKVLEKEQSMEEAIKEIVKEEEEEEQRDLPEEDKVMEEEVMEKEAALEESLEEKVVEEEEEDMAEADTVEEWDLSEEDIDEEEHQKDLADEEKEDEKDLTEEESLEEVTEVAVAWPGDPKGYNGPEIPKGDDMPAAVPIEDEVSQNTQWA